MAATATITVSEQTYRRFRQLAESAGVSVEEYLDSAAQGQTAAIESRSLGDLPVIPSTGSGKFDLAALDFDDLLA